MFGMLNDRCVLSEILNYLDNFVFMLQKNWILKFCTKSFQPGMMALLLKSFSLLYFWLRGIIWSVYEVRLELDVFLAGVGIWSWDQLFKQTLSVLFLHLIIVWPHLKAIFSPYITLVMLTYRDYRWKLGILCLCQMKDIGLLTATPWPQSIYSIVWVVMLLFWCYPM